MPDTHVPDKHGAGPFPPVTTAEIADEIWLEVARRHAEGAAVGSPADQASPAATARAPGMLPLPALLALDGAAFIDAAYETVLGRPADDVGRAHLVAELGRGCDKLDLLGNLQASPEGQVAGRVIDGLQERARSRRLQRLPVVRRVVRLGTAVLRRSGLSRALGPRPAPDLVSRAETQAHLAALETTVDTWRRAMEGQLIEHRLAVDNVTRRMATVQAAHEELGRKTMKAMAEQGRLLATLTERSAGFARQLAATEDSVIDSLLGVADSVTSQEKRLKALEGVVDLGEVASRIDAAAGALRAELDGRVIAAEAITEQNRREVADQQRRIGLMLNALRDRVPPAVDAQDDHAMDALYLAFEDRFRGTRADIKQRQRVYLPRLREGGIGQPDRPVLDIGAGRGEFLDLMRDEGLTARGVDSNESMVAACRDAGLDCVEGDALAYLAAQPDGSLGAVTGFHIVEHIPFKTVVRIMDEALRVLVPGGLIIFETPNPANLLTASRYFYLDPTHRNPLPGEMMAMIAEARGFIDAEIVALHPMAARFPGTDRQLAGALDEIFHGPQDYALVAKRP